jgi:hypothetical protein
MKDFNFVEENLFFVLRELEAQPEVASYFPKDIMSYGDQLAQLREYLEDAGEYGLAYEGIVSLLETMPFKLTGQATIKLLEVGLLFGFKTDADKDKNFDKRSR